MNHAQACKAAHLIYVRWFGSSFEPQRTDSGVSSPHLAWMCLEIPNLSENKSMRWLGYIQGVLVAQGRATLEQMKDISREAISDD